MDDSTNSSVSTTEAPVHKPYFTPTLTVLGDVVSLTQAEYGGLDKKLYGYLFAQTSLSLPDPPTR